MLAVAAATAEPSGAPPAVAEGAEGLSAPSSRAHTGMSAAAVAGSTYQAHE